MNNEFDLNTRNMIAIMLIQALWGAISPNFRRVAITFDYEHIDLLFTLNEKSDEDIEEIKDVVDEFDCLLCDLNNDDITLNFEINIDSTPLEPLDPAKGFPVFLRKEVN